MHAFLMFSSFQMPLQMRLATQLVIIFILLLLCFQLCAVFSALSSAARTASQYQASMQNDPISYAEITKQKILVRPTLANPEIEDLTKMQSQSLLGCGSGLPPSLGLHSFPQLFPGLTVSPSCKSGLRGAKAPMLTMPQAIHFISAP